MDKIYVSRIEYKEVYEYKYDYDDIKVDKIMELAKNIIKYYNALFASNSVKYLIEYVADTGVINVVKEETIKKLFSKKYKYTPIITFNIVEDEQDID